MGGFKNTVRRGLPQTWGDRLMIVGRLVARHVKGTYVKKLVYFAKPT